MNIFKNFMMGRYGTDQLTLALLIAGMILTFVSDALHSNLLISFTYVIFFACLFRTMSRNIAARQKENSKFLQYWNPVRAWFKGKFNIKKHDRNYKYFKCPNCKQMMRVPRGKGQISITCQKCNEKFIQKS